MTRSPRAATPPTWQIVAAFAAVYIIWGSTYLGIRFAIETVPPFLMAASRFLVAGTLMVVFLRLRGAPAPTLLNWRSTLIVGGLLLMGGNGGVTWAEQRVPSGLAALMVAMVPLWMVMLDWLRPRGQRPANMVLIGVGLGLVGVVLLASQNDAKPGETLEPLGLAVLLAATFCWALGSLYARRAPLPASPLLTTGMEMICGGALLLVAGTLNGEWSRLRLDQISPRSGLALIYLTIFGSLIAFSCYVWLLKVSTPARAATYAYVNPVVAVFLGWALAGEPLTARTLVAAAIIVGAVVLITAYKGKSPAPEKALDVTAAAPESG
jgi:drug/metabolite transporter (DMT)-like permease